MIPKSNIGERLDFWNTKEYEIINLQLNIGDYTGVSQFIAKSLWSSDSYLILGLPWIETLGTFILNVENKFLTFSYKKKKITLQDINMKSKVEVASSEDFREISKVMSQGDEKSIQTIHKDFDKVIASKEEDISRLRDHNQKFLAHQEGKG